MAHLRPMPRCPVAADPPPPPPPPRLEAMMSRPWASRWPPLAGCGVTRVSHGSGPVQSLGLG